jgi:hypothetical protein
MTSASAGPWMMDRCKVTAIPVNANCEADIVNVENVQLGSIYSGWHFNCCDRANSDG